MIEAQHRPGLAVSPAMWLGKFILAALLSLYLPISLVPGQDAPNLNDIPNELVIPATVRQDPAPGKRVWQKLEAYRHTRLEHTLYLPTDWQAGAKYPVIFEYPGNGGFRNALGDTSDGTVDGCRLGYGLCQGQRAIWVCLPFVDPKNNQHALNWWGDADETVRYCLATIDTVCSQWGGDEEHLVLCGFSRGAIATSYIGLRNDEIARKWQALMAHSHYDGVRKWSYVDSDPESAVVRGKRFHGKPQWISHELSSEATKQFLIDHQLFHDRLMIVNLPFRNHSPDWILKDLTIAHEARKWWQSTLAAP